MPTQLTPHLSRRLGHTLSMCRGVSLIFLCVHICDKWRSAPLLLFGLLLLFFFTQSIKMKENNPLCSALLLCPLCGLCVFITNQNVAVAECIFYTINLFSECWLVQLFVIFGTREFQSWYSVVAIISSSSWQESHHYNSPHIKLTFHWSDLVAHAGPLFHDAQRSARSLILWYETFESYKSKNLPFIIIIYFYFL